MIVVSGRGPGHVASEVRDAPRDCLKRVDRPADVTVHGELVHNERGAPPTREPRLPPEPPRIAGTVSPSTDARPSSPAHGISQREKRSRLHLPPAKTLIDSTCPLVTRAHERGPEAGRRRAITSSSSAGPGHVEVRGIVEDLESYSLVSRRRVGSSPFPHDRLGVMCQTTTPTARRRRDPRRDSPEESRRRHQVRRHDLLARRRSTSSRSRI